MTPEKPNEDELAAKWRHILGLSPMSNLKVAQRLIDRLTRAGFKLVYWDHAGPRAPRQKPWYPDSGYVAEIRSPEGDLFEKSGDTRPMAAFLLYEAVTEAEAEEP